MRTWILASALVVAGIGILACGTLLHQHAAAPFVDPGPHFDHAGHLKRGIDCNDCHGAEKEGFYAMPPLSACNQCHEEIDAKKPPEKRATSYYDSTGKQGIWTESEKLPREVIFSHASHVQALGKKCVDCHKEVIESTGQVTTTFIAMDACMACHATAAPAKNQCETCHRELRVDRRPPSHDLGWKRAHGRLAAAGEFDPLPANCTICHKKSDCDTCHRAEAPADHTNFWRLRGHATVASLDRDRCRVCHTTDSCFLCHQHTKPRNHTPTWGGTFQRHCWSCHLPLESFDDQGCFVCHKSSPGHLTAPVRPGNAPHMTSNPANCRVCHTPATLKHPDNGQSCLLCHH